MFSFFPQKCRRLVWCGKLNVFGHITVSRLGLLLNMNNGRTAITTASDINNKEYFTHDR